MIESDRRRGFKAKKIKIKVGSDAYEETNTHTHTHGEEVPGINAVSCKQTELD